MKSIPFIDSNTVLSHTCYSVASIFHITPVNEFIYVLIVIYVMYVCCVSVPVVSVCVIVMLWCVTAD